MQLSVVVGGVLQVPLNIRSVTAAGQAVYADETVSEPDSPSSTDILGRLENFNNLNQYTTGRVGIWKVFSKYINWTGNDVTYTLPVRVLHYTGQSARYYTTTHNNAYDIVIRAGLPAGIIYLLMQLIALVYSLKKIFGRRKNNLAVTTRDALEHDAFGAHAQQRVRFFVAA